MRVIAAHLVITTSDHSNETAPTGAQLKGFEKMTLQQERDLKAANLEIWETKVTPLATMMLDGERYKKGLHSWGMETDDTVLTDAGERATLLIAAGRFKDGGELLQQAMYENCLENACLYLDLDINEVRP